MKTFSFKTESKSDNKAEDVGPAPAPSPCKIVSPAGLLLTIFPELTRWCHIMDKCTGLMPVNI